MTGTDLFTLGEVLAVLLAEDGLPIAEAARFRRTTAGSELNVAVGLSRLGRRARVLTAVGDDGLGAAVTAQARGWGVDLRAFVVGDAPTGAILRTTGAGRLPVEVVHLRRDSAARRLSPEHVRAAWPETPRAVFLTGITAVLSESGLAACLETARRAREVGSLVVLDPNLRLGLAAAARFRSALASLVPYADVVVAGEDELPMLVEGARDAETAMRMLADRGIRLVVAKCGARGSWAIADGRRLTQPAIPGPVLDPVGAGDAFAAGLVHALLDAAEPEDALRLAAEVASFVVGTPGDIEGLPSARALGADDGEDVRR